jgi:hypothetical protein
VFSTVPIFQHFDITLHKFRSCHINLISLCMWSWMYRTYTHMYPHWAQYIFCVSVHAFIFFRWLGTIQYQFHSR